MATGRPPCLKQPDEGKQSPAKAPAKKHDPVRRTVRVPVDQDERLNALQRQYNLDRSALNQILTQYFLDDLGDWR